MRIERDITRETRTKTQVGLLNVRSGWQRVHFATGNVRNCYGMCTDRQLSVTMTLIAYSRSIHTAGYLQNGWFRDENARGREHARKANR